MKKRNNQCSFEKHRINLSFYAVKKVEQYLERSQAKCFSDAVNRLILSN